MDLAIVLAAIFLIMLGLALIFEHMEARHKNRHLSNRVAAEQRKSAREVYDWERDGE